MILCADPHIIYYSENIRFIFGVCGQKIINHYLIRLTKPVAGEDICVVFLLLPQRRQTDV